MPLVTTANPSLKDTATSLLLRLKDNGVTRKPPRVTAVPDMAAPRRASTLPTINHLITNKALDGDSTLANTGTEVNDFVRSANI